MLSYFFDSFNTNAYPLVEYGTPMIQRLLETGLGPSEITFSQILPTAVAMVPNQAQVFTQIIDYYLSDEGQKHLVPINRIAKEDSPESDDKLLRYCMEAIRLHGIFGSYREAKTNVTLKDQGRRLNIKPGEKVFVSFVSSTHTRTAVVHTD
jgi:linoleate 10R-lipoxygenase